MATFTWTPSYNSALNKEPATIDAKFGDGYEQSSANGINNVRKRWSLQFAFKTQSEADAIDAFLTTRAGWESFTWTDPDGATLAYRCKAWQKLPVSYNNYTVSCVFEQVFI